MELVLRFVRVRELVDDWLWSIVLLVTRLDDGRDEVDTPGWIDVCTLKELVMRFVRPETVDNPPCRFVLVDP